MGESFRVVNLDKRQYFGGSSLGGCSRFNSLQCEPLSGMLVWLLTKTAQPDKPRFRGSWDGDRIVIAGDEGVHQDLFEQSVAYQDVSVPLIEEWIDGDVCRAMEYWGRGLVDDDGTFVPGRRDQDERAARREDAKYPLDKWEARLTSRCSGPAGRGTL